MGQMELQIYRKTLLLFAVHMEEKVNIAVLAISQKTFKQFTEFLVSEQGYASDTNFVWIKSAKDIPDGILFDHVLVHTSSDVEELKQQIPLKHAKFEN
jgi:hypothetical protein